MTATNGTIWTKQDMGDNTASVGGIPPGNGTFAAVGSRLSGPAFSTSAILTSPDGMIWTSRTSGILDQAYDNIGYGNGTFVAVCLRGAGSGGSGIAAFFYGVCWSRSGVFTH